MSSVFSKTAEQKPHSAAQKQIKYKKRFITFHFLSIVTLTLQLKYIWQNNFQCQPPS